MSTPFLLLALTALQLVPASVREETAARARPIAVLEDGVLPEPLLPGREGVRRVVLRAVPDASVTLVGSFVPGEDAEVAGTPRLERGSEPGLWTLELPLRAWRIGWNRTGPVELEVDGARTTLPELDYRVASPVPPDMGRDRLAAAEPARAGSGFGALAFVWLLGTSVLAMAWGRVRMRPGSGQLAIALPDRRRNATAAPRWTGTLPAHDVEAMAAEARAHPTVVAAGVTDTMTSEEAARACHGPDPDLADALHALLQAADRVKFGGEEIPPSQAERLAIRFLEAASHARR